MTNSVPKGNLKFRGKLALVVGGSEGIGLAVAKDLARLGVNVVVAARTLDKLEAAVSGINSIRRFPDQLTAWKLLDVSDASGVKLFFEQFIKDIGTPDFLINCAGLALPGDIGDIPVEDLRSMVEVNFNGTIFLTEAVVKSMKKARTGVIVHFSSMAGFIALPGHAVYSGSKFAVAGFCEALKRELDPFGIKVLVVFPPNTRTPALERELANPAMPEALRKLEETATTVEPEDVSSSLMKALFKYRFRVFVTWDSWFYFWISRLFPRVIDIATRRPVQNAP